MSRSKIRFKLATIMTTKTSETEKQPTISQTAKQRNSKTPQDQINDSLHPR
jgi:hypothetical protein